MLVRRGYALESVAARICREAGGRVRTNMFVRDMDLDVPVNNGRRLEVVADGLPLHGGPVGSGHFGVCTTCGWETMMRSSEPGWGRAAGSQTQEGGHVSGAGRPSQLSQVGGLGSGGRRKTVG